MTGQTLTIGPTTAYLCAAEGHRLACEADALDLIGETYADNPEWILIPKERLAPSFLDLKSGDAGHFLQKLVTYKKRVALIGDFSESLGRSKALRDFVRECNQGQQIWFLECLADVEARLGQKASETA